MPFDGSNWRDDREPKPRPLADLEFAHFLYSLLVFGLLIAVLILYVHEIASIITAVDN